MHVHWQKSGKNPSDLVPPLHFSITGYTIFVAGLLNERNFVLSDNKINEQKIYQNRQRKNEL